MKTFQGAFIATAACISLSISLDGSAATREDQNRNKNDEIFYRETPIKGIDVHMHPGSYDSLGPLGKAFILGNLPDFLPDFLKDFSLKVSASFLQNPYGPFIGIKSQCLSAGFEMCGLFATYAPETWGVVTNAEILNWLRDKNNINPKTGKPMFFGLASLDMTNWQENKETSLKELENSLKDPLFKGIKLAFIHNNLPLDDPQYDGIYAVAARTGKPVYHHTGSSPIRKLSEFPTLEEQQNYIRSYDPNGLERVIQAYPNVTFILGHMGFDFNAEGITFDESVFQLAQKYNNVALEISAFGGQFYDGDGRYKDKTFARIKAQNLIGRTIYGSDGPGAPGGLKRYLNGVLASLDREGYTVEEAEAILSQNATRVFKLEQ